MAAEVMLNSAVALLSKLIETPSYSRDEGVATELLVSHLEGCGIVTERYGNNICCYNRYYDDQLPTILLNSHIDTVKPWRDGEYNPHQAAIKEGKLYGLGSNDAGASLVSLVEVFKWLYNREGMKYNVVLGLSAEEEVSGRSGMEMLLKSIKPISFAIVGEPTSMQMAVSERGLMVVDCQWHGRAGHAAREEGDNAIYHAVDDICWIKDYSFEKISQTLGATTMKLTQIEAGSQHNVIPDSCKAVVDIRVSDSYSFGEILDIMRANLKCDIEPRSQRLRPSKIALSHPVVVAAKALGVELFGSATLSDQALMSFDSVKIGPGDSQRSHTKDEYVYISQIEEGIEMYKKLLESIL